MKQPSVARHSGSWIDQQQLAAIVKGSAIQIFVVAGPEVARFA